MLMMCYYFSMEGFYEKRKIIKSTMLLSLIVPTLVNVEFVAELEATQL